MPASPTLKAARQHRDSLSDMIAHVEEMEVLLRDIDKVVIFDHLPNGSTLQERIEDVLGITDT